MTTAPDTANPATTPLLPRARRPRSDDGPADVRRYTPLARAGIITALLVVAVLWLAPLVWALLTSLKQEADTTTVPLEVIPERGFTLQAYASVLANGNLVTWFVNSTVVALVVTVLTVALSAAAAYGFSRTRFRGRNALFALTIAGIMVPPQILIVPLYRQMLAMGLADTYAGIILPQLVLPAMVFILKKFFDGIPHELEEAARVDGAGSLRIFLQIVLPLSRSILAAVVDLRVHPRVEQLPVAVHHHLRPWPDDAPGGAGAGAERVRSSLCPGDGLGDPRRTAADRRVHAVPAPDHPRGRHHRPRRNVSRTTIQEGTPCPAHA